MKLNSLVIGSTSQLAHYFPEEYEKTSSRNIDLSLYKNNTYDRIYITFAEQHLELNTLTPFIETNVNLTLDLIDFFKNKTNYIIVYGSCELWNNYIGEIDLNDNFDFNINCPYTRYCISKRMMIEKIHQLDTKKVIVLYPFNFNSIYRKPGQLFYKIFDSIINKKKVEIGDTYFYRDIIHPKYVVERSILAIEDEMVGSGRIIFVNDFIRELYIKSGLNYNDYVTENYNMNIIPKKKILYLKSKEIKYSYNDLLNDTLNDLKIWIN
jgi:nucleoside-diphosphate-sugar epimerase